MVRPEIVTTPPTLKTRLAALPFIARTFAPGPLIVTLEPIYSSPLVSVIVPVTEAAKLIVSPSVATRIASRSVVFPLSVGSAVLSTM